MYYKAFLYIFFVMLSAFAISGINFDNIIRRNRKYESRALVIILSCISGYLLTNFIVDFLEVSKLF